jgi:Protein of unknown function (DUF2569)
MNSDYVGVKGWLLFLCLVLTLLNPVASIVNIFSSFKFSAPFFNQYPGLKIITMIDGLLSVGVVCFSIYAGISLWRIRPKGVSIVKTFLLTFMAYAIVANILPFLAGLPANANEAMTAQAFIGVLRSAIIVVLWYLYLVKSKRVRSTFPDPAAKAPSKNAPFE